MPQWITELSKDTLTTVSVILTTVSVTLSTASVTLTTVSVILGGEENSSTRPQSLLRVSLQAT